MPRPATPADGPDIVDLVVVAGMFERDDANVITQLLAEPGDTTCVVEDAADGYGLAAMLVYRPEDATDRAYDLTIIAVRPDLQGTGRGTKLVRYAENALSARGQRMLIVRTSSPANMTAPAPSIDGWATQNKLVCLTTGPTATTSSYSPDASDTRPNPLRRAAKVAFLNAPFGPAIARGSAHPPNDPHAGHASFTHPQTRAHPIDLAGPCDRTDGAEALVSSDQRVDGLGPRHLGRGST